MAIINQSFEISSCDDVELNLKRTSKLEYRISYDDEKENKAIVFIIGGYGANANIYFLDFDREYIAKNFSVVAVHVFYHCFCMRPSKDLRYSAKLGLTKDDLPILAQTLTSLGIACNNLSEGNAAQYYNFVSDHIQTLKDRGVLEQDYKAILSASFIPANDEYANVGIMAALDHINALKDIVKRFPEFKNLPKIYGGGGSYGGYLSLLVAKIAPWYVDGVVDNSGSALPSLDAILGRWVQQAEFFYHGSNVTTGAFVKTHWTRDVNSPYFFTNENYMIRSLLYSQHLILAHAKNQNIIFRGYHSLQDKFDTAKDKQTLFLAYKELGYDASLTLIKDENDVDGRFIKDLEHGMRISDRALLKKELPLMLEKFQGKSFSMQENSISYPCGSKVFTFKDEGDQMKLEIKENNGTRE